VHGRSRLKRKDIEGGCVGKGVRKGGKKGTSQLQEKSRARKREGKGNPRKKPSISNTTRTEEGLKVSGLWRGIGK